MATAADPFLSESAAFHEAATRAMALAFEDICDTLNLPADADDERKAIAIRIVDLARAGVTDPHVLSDRVVREANTPDLYIDRSWSVEASPWSRRRA